MQEHLFHKMFLLERKVSFSENTKAKFKETFNVKTLKILKNPFHFGQHLFKSFFELIYEWIKNF